ncbi:MAG: DUF4013 domain-containing protein [Anaerolineae bacterium]|nr:DUF4013 domain-containing protein [Anaerolineae bacterium]
MDIGRAFGFVFEDEQWFSKLLLGAVISLIPIFGQFALIGYGITVIRNVIAGHPRPLPEWDDLGGYFMDGLMIWIAQIVYALPLIIAACFIFTPAFLPLLAGENENLMAILGGVSTVLIIGASCVMGLYGLLIWLVTPMIQVQYAVRKELGACLRVGEIVRLTFSNIGNILIALGMIMVVGVVFSTAISVAYGVLGVIPIIGWMLMLPVGLLVLPFGVWVNVFSAYLYGQVGRASGFAQAV